MLIFSAVISCAAAENVYSLPVDFTPGIKPLPSNYLSETEYQDPSLHVTIETGRKDECDYWVARIKISHPSQLRTAAAAGFENDYTTKGTFIAKRQNAVLAINGDYYSYYQYGYILRQGKLFRDKLRAERDVLAIDEDGNFHILFTPDRNTMAPTLNGKKLINAFHFGPALVVDGEVGTLEASYWLAPESKRQRMCIAQTGELEYMALCCAGPLRGSQGMTLYQFADLAKELGARTAYNLDGGDSTMMIFNGQKINDKENKNTRDISDLIYFASAWDGK
ncbi:MAG: phosphodiester glycosidase family protein [Clostridia bacterium]|nr:phosphodiester glycosidase family protein [Clostridia bacterium]